MLFVDILSYSADNMRCASQGDKRDKYHSLPPRAPISTEYVGVGNGGSGLAQERHRTKRVYIVKRYCPFQEQ